MLAASDSPGAQTLSKRRQGEYKGILGLIRIMKHGALVKEETDLAIDVCGAVHNIRESISVVQQEVSGIIGSATMRKHAEL